MPSVEQSIIPSEVQKQIRNTEGKGFPIRYSSFYPSVSSAFSDWSSTLGQIFSGQSSNYKFVWYNKKQKLFQCWNIKFKWLLSYLFPQSRKYYFTGDIWWGGNWKTWHFVGFTFTADVRNGWLLFWDNALTMPVLFTSIHLSRSFLKYTV